MTLTMTRESSPEVPLDVPDLELIEDDDVAFALTLSREIDRIYGRYLGGDLAPADDLGRALRLTGHALIMLRGAVTKGMPAMRIEVAGAQAREMLTVLFGDTVPASGSLVASGGPGSIGLGAPWSTDGSDRFGGAGSALASGGAGRPPLVAAPTPPTHPSEPPVAVPGRLGVTTVAGRLRPVEQFVDGQRLFVRLVLELICYCIVGALIDVPVAVIALFPAEFVPLTAGFVGLPVALWILRRLGPRCLRRPTGAPPSPMTPALQQPSTTHG